MAKAIKGKRSYHQIYDGDWTKPRHRNFKEQCCDCGLVHTIDFRVTPYGVEFRTRRDARATAAARRSFNFSKDN